MLGLGVVGRTHQSCVVHGVCVQRHVSKHQRRHRDDHDQQPHACDHPPHHLPAGQGVRSGGQHHGHQPVHAHQRDQEDRGVHVGVAQVEQAFTHDLAEDPRALGQVDDEEDGERHEEAVGARQVEDEDGGDGALPGARQDAPDDEEVAGDAQEEDEAHDDGAQGCGVAIAHWVFKVGVIFLHARKILDPGEKRRR